MHTFKRAMVTAGLLSLIALPVSAQTGTPPSPRAKQPAPPTGAAQATGAKSKLASADTKFMHEAAIGGMSEVALGRLAADKASNADVKQFGQRMVDDHSKANDELKALASQKGETLPTEVDSTHKALEAKLSKLSGEAFDKAYMTEMVRDHTEDVAAFRKASTGASDSDLKAWAGKTLPTLEEHLTMAKSTATKMGASGGSKSSSETPKKSSGSK